MDKSKQSATKEATRETGAAQNTKPKKSVIRWSGLIAFLLISGLLAGAGAIFAPNLIRSSIEGLGTELVGGKVDVASVSLHLSPVGLTIKGLEVTNPNEPMTNWFEAENLELTLNPSLLLWKKLQIENLEIRGVKTATPRQHSGELPGGRKTQQLASQMVDFDLPGLKQMDLDPARVKSLVESADLITLQRVEALKQSQSRLKSQWQQALDKTSFDKRISAIKAEYQRLSQRAKDNKLNVLADSKDWKKLKKSINDEREQIASLKAKLKTDKNQLSEALSQVKAGPKDDLNRIMQDHVFFNGSEDLASHYLGPVYGQYINQVIALVKSQKPADSSSAAASIDQNPVVQNLTLGQRVYFKDVQTFPDLLVKSLHLSGTHADWQLNGDGDHWGYLPWLTGKPGQLNLDLSADQAGLARIKLVTDWPLQHQMKSQISASARKLAVKNRTLLQTSKGNWTLLSGLVDAELTGEVSFEQINLNATLKLFDAKITTPENLPSWQKNLAESLNAGEPIEFSLTATGSLEQPEINLKTSLENIIKRAIGDQVKQQKDQLKLRVEKALSEKLGDFSALEKANLDLDQSAALLDDQDLGLKAILEKIKL